MNKIKVSSKSNPSSLAGSIASSFKETDTIELHSIGAGALNQSIKGIIIAKSFFAPLGKELIVNPSFEDVNINEEEKTGIKLQVTCK